MANSHESWRAAPYNIQLEIDSKHIKQQAQVRWLRPPEIWEILRNYQKYGLALSPAPPNKPSSGSLFVFDRNVLRYFRKDGHNWRKKNDGKTVREAHERLKIGSIDVLHCYYAHGEENPNFQRRSYWMLEGAYEHIVLVHYLEVTQGARLGTYRLPCDSATEVTIPASNSEDQSSLTPALLIPSPRPHSLVLSPGNSEPEVNGPSPSGSVEFVHSSFSSVFEEESVENVQESLVVNAKASRKQPSLLDQIPDKSIEDLTADLQSTTIDWSVFMSSAEPSSAKGPNDRPQFEAGFARDGQHVLHSFLAQPSNLKTDVGNTRNDSHPGSVSHISTSMVQNWKALPQEASRHQENEAVVQVTTTEHLINQECYSPSWAELLEMCNRNESVDFILNPKKRLQQASQVGMQPSLNSMLPELSVNRPPQTKLEAQLRAVTAENALEASAEEESFSRVSNAPQQLEAWNYENGMQQQQQQYKQQEQYKNSMGSGTSKWSDNKYWLKEYLQNEPDMLRMEARDNASAHSISSTLSTQPDNGSCKQSPPINKQDSFDRWCNEAIYEENGSPLFMPPSDVGPGWVASLEEEVNGKENSRWTQQRQMDIALTVSISPMQEFSIQDFSPDWSFAFEESKVLINGTFLKSAANPDYCSWSCMFGEAQVPAEIVNNGVLRCKAPPHAPGRVPFYVTRGERLACSEIREFEFRAKSDLFSQASTLPTDGSSIDFHKKESLFQIRLARMLFSKLEDSSFCKFQRNGDGEEPIDMSRLNDIDNPEEWDSIEKLVDSASSQIELKEKLLQMLLKQKLQDWLLSTINEEERGASVLNGQGQGLLHLVAALNYHWAISPILAAGINVNFRDQHGWTALHYAAAYGREKAVLALLAAGAAAGPLTDPSPQNPDGRTPADLASSNGHRGIAAFLAEMSLTMHLKSLTLKEKPENQIYAISADWEGENAVQSVTDKGNVEPCEPGSDEETSLRQSLRAVRNAAQTAALIRAIFRQHSFHQREELSSGLLDEHGMSHSQIKKLVAALKLQKIFQGNWKKRESAATKIQRQFRGWKGRKEFLDLRQRVIKIQAHVRGHQVRRKYKKILWSVGVLEKAILRWRRKRMGLRNFRAETIDPGSEMNEGETSDEDDFLKEGRKQKELAIEKAVTRVQSMVKSAEARAQYVRLLEGSHHTIHDLNDGGNESYDEDFLLQQKNFDMSLEGGLDSDPSYS